MKTVSTTTPAGSDRIPALDVVRGFALFGILVANLTWNIHLSNPPEPMVSSVATWTSYFTTYGVNWGFQDKFYTLFAFLFGAGFAWQYQRTPSPAPAPLSTRDPHQTAILRTRFRRRIVSLFGIGLAHQLLLWSGDILHVYAWVGCGLWLVRKWDTSTLFWLAVLILVTNGWMVIGLNHLFAGLPVLDNSSGLDPAAWEALLQLRQESLTSTRYTDVVRAHALALWWDYSKFGFLTEYFPKIFGRFLLGACAVRSGFLLNTPASAAQRLRVLKWSLPAALVTSVARAWLSQADGPIAVSLQQSLDPVLDEGTTLALAAFYLTAIWAFSERKPDHYLIQSLRLVGRMPLTHYLLQSFLYVLLFYQYAGLGLIGQVDYSIVIPVVFIFFPLQIGFSRVWSRWYPYGPLDLLWRWFIYRGTATGPRPPPPAKPLSVPEL